MTAKNGLKFGRDFWIPAMETGALTYLIKNLSNERNATVIAAARILLGRPKVAHFIGIGFGLLIPAINAVHQYFIFGGHVIDIKNHALEEIDSPTFASINPKNEYFFIHNPDGASNIEVSFFSVAARKANAKESVNRVDYFYLPQSGALASNGLLMTQRELLMALETTPYERVFVPSGGLGGEIVTGEDFLQRQRVTSSMETL